jgi:hypothetical protein
MTRWSKQFLVQYAMAHYSKSLDTSRARSDCDVATAKIFKEIAVIRASIPKNSVSITITPDQ